MVEDEKFSQNFSSLALPVWDRHYLEDSERKVHRLNQLINNEGVCRTARATPGLLDTPHSPIQMRLVAREERRRKNTLLQSCYDMIQHMELIISVEGTRKNIDH